MPDCRSEMAQSVCTPVLQFLRYCGGGPWGPPSSRHLTGEDESLAPTHCLDKRVIASLCGAVWLAYIHFVNVETHVET